VGTVQCVIYGTYKPYYIQIDRGIHSTSIPIMYANSPGNTIWE